MLVPDLDHQLSPDAARKYVTGQVGKRLRGHDFHLLKMEKLNPIIVPDEIVAVARVEEVKGHGEGKRWPVASVPPGEKKPARGG